MNEAFGDNWSAVFTPPWNRCTEDTFRALDYLGFEAISRDRGKQPITGYKFRVSELTAQMDEIDTIGIMLHHKVMDVAAFSMLERMIETLRSCPNVHFHTFQSLLGANRKMRPASN
jgi:hypothetical protein